LITRKGGGRAAVRLGLGPQAHPRLKKGKDNSSNRRLNRFGKTNLARGGESQGLIYLEKEGRRKGSAAGSGRVRKEVLPFAEVCG